MTEEKLLRQGFKKIEAQYGGRCSFCRQRYAAGEEIYWKSPPTTVCCPRCYYGQHEKSISAGHIRVQYPQCGHTFDVLRR